MRQQGFDNLVCSQRRSQLRKLLLLFARLKALPFISDMLWLSPGAKWTFYGTIKIDSFVKSPVIVMPDLIRHPEHIDLTGFRLSPE